MSCIRKRIDSPVSGFLFHLIVISLLVVPALLSWLAQFMFYTTDQVVLTLYVITIPVAIFFIVIANLVGLMARNLCLLFMFFNFVFVIFRVSIFGIFAADGKFFDKLFLYGIGIYLFFNAIFALLFVMQYMDEIKNTKFGLAIRKVLMHKICITKNEFGKKQITFIEAGKS